MGSSMPSLPRITNADGTTNIRCRACGRIIARARSPLITTVTQCAICLGYPPENVLPKYIQSDITKPPLPLIDPADEVVTLYPEERLETPLGKWGWLRPLYKVLGWLAEPEDKTPKKSVRAAKRKKNKGLFEPAESESEQEQP